MVSLQLKLHSCAKFRKYRVKHYGWYAVHNAFIYCTAAHSWPSEEVFCAVCFVYCLLINYFFFCSWRFPAQSIRKCGQRSESLPFLCLFNVTSKYKCDVVQVQSDILAEKL